MSSDFICIHCKREVVSTPAMGTKNRNHCPYCLYSRHVDVQVGDRKSSCGGEMKPIGLSFKPARQAQGKDKGEMMLIHKCEKCGKLSINRIAADDDVQLIQKAYEDSLRLATEEKEELTSQGITPVGEEDREEVRVQLFGK